MSAKCIKVEAMAPTEIETEMGKIADELRAVSEALRGVHQHCLEVQMYAWDAIDNNTFKCIRDAMNDVMCAREHVALDTARMRKVK